MARRPALSREAASWPLGPRSGPLPRNERRSGVRPRLVVSSGGPSLLVVGPTPTPPPVEVVDASDAPPPSSRRRGTQQPRRLGRALAALALLALTLLGAASRTVEGTPLRAFATWSSVMRLPEAVARRVRAGHDANSAMGLASDTIDPVNAEVPGRPDPLKRQGHASIPGGILFAPRSFSTSDGAYDLLVHFHGNTAVVHESVELAGLDAMVAVVNLGIGSAPYEEAYAIPGTWERLLESIQRGAGERGIHRPKLRRVALSGWSAGYGAISTILQVRKGHEDLDAILSLDGIHCGFEMGGLNGRQMAPFAGAARKAASGDILFSITHSAIDPKAYASTTATADYLLAAAGGRRDAAQPPPRYLSLASMKGAVARDREKTMEPTSEARVGQLVVRGYRGETPEHHMAHLFQMAATVLPDLVARWR